MTPLDDLYAVLRTRTGFEVVETSGADVAKGRLRLVGRVPAERRDAWVLLIHALLIASRADAWSVDVSRMYFVRDTPGGPKLFYTWRLIFQSEGNLLAHVPAICQVIARAPRPTPPPVDEVDLPGAPPERNSRKAFLPGQFIHPGAR